ncbi:type II toxin-antitoxin system RelE/ParE family toxin [Micromonospora sp. C95]|uniref:type II toxin-antitoxin system RelE/ParE family toxin n=1 Tax=Micromonospora sp. C95 TaxID=2824882 RepID=UPI001B36471F|nr:type II toxin-antitoxin system RelE/ParE family toxin [Micromonospora sp. C95]MBQ1024054.1 type II toxin-antitoxin system RelE/ParE family toxin [Micromonospora sp. C95]
MWTIVIATRPHAVAASRGPLAEQGLLLGEPYTKQLDGKLRELRFYLERQAVRITYWIASDKRIILLTVFHKTRVCATSERSTEHAGYWPDALMRRTASWRRRASSWASVVIGPRCGSAVARFEAGGTVPTLPVLERLAAALEVSLSVSFEPRDAAA